MHEMLAKYTRVFLFSASLCINLILLNAILSEGKEKFYLLFIL